MNPATSTSDRSLQSSLTTKTVIAVGLAALTFAVYRPVCDYEFVNFDDDVHVYANSYVTGGLTKANLRWALGIHGPSQWHPLAWLSHQLDCQLFGLNAGRHHLTNLLLHIANTMLVFLVFSRMTHSVWKSAFVAGVFAVHPLNIESVAWVSERRNVLSMMLGLLTIAAYAWYSERGGWLRYAVVLGLFSLGLMAKPLLVTLPFVLVLFDFWPLERLSRMRRQARPGGDVPVSARSECQGSGFLIIEKVPLFALAAASSVLTILCQKGIMASAESLPLPIRVLNAFAAVGIYLRKLVWPEHLAVFYPHPGLTDENPAAVLLAPAAVGFGVVVVISVWSLISLRRRPYVFVGWCWFLGTLVPMIGLVQSGQQQMADRYLYLPMLGALVCVAWFLSEFTTAGFRRKSVSVWLGGLIVFAFALATVRHLPTWRNSITLFEQAISATRRNSWAHNNLGLALHQQGDSGRAALHFVEALRLDPDYALGHYNLGIVLHEVGRTQQAIREFEAALKLQPSYVDAELRLGAAWADLGQLATAAVHFERAIALAPENASAHLNLGIVLGRQGKVEAAGAKLREAARLDPSIQVGRRQPRAAYGP